MPTHRKTTKPQRPFNPRKDSYLAVAFARFRLRDQSPQHRDDLIEGVIADMEERDQVTGDEAIDLCLRLAFKRAKSLFRCEGKMVHFVVDPYAEERRQEVNQMLLDHFRR